MRIDLKNAAITFKDGGSETITLKIGEGNLTFREARNMEYFLDRGTLDTVREGDQIPVDLTLNLVWEELRGTSGGTASSGSTPTPYDVLHHVGGAVDWDSSSSDPCEPFAVDVQIVVTPPCGQHDVKPLFSQTSDGKH